MENNYISDTVSYLEDIQPHLLTMLYAGVGSGKNHFINQLMIGLTDKQHDGTEVKLDPLYVLLITSRRSKVDELLTEEDLPIDERVDKWNWYRQFTDPAFFSVEPTGKQILLEGEHWSSNYFMRMPLPHPCSK